VEKQFWDSVWQQEHLGFHQAKAHPALERRFAEFIEWLGLEPSNGFRTLVPLCGKSPDLTWLAARCEVVGVEFVERAAQDYFAELGVKPEVTTSVVPAYSHGRTKLLVGDYFSVRPEHTGRLDVAYDRAALVAVKPEQRVDYLVQTGRLLEPRGGLFLISFEHDTGSGPPFSVEELPRLFERCRESGVPYRFERIEERDILDEEPRFRDRGATFMRESVWFAQREV
jgi:thiopurine S-methyltransferase